MYSVSVSWKYLIFAVQIFDRRKHYALSRRREHYALLSGRMTTKPKDARVSSAISHWAPRFVSNGVLLADFEDVTGSLERWEDWCAAWSARAKVHEDLGREALTQEFRMTA
ncbi:MAG TPA: hypothetical protein VFX94_08785, partial [Burkholderiales bacterium]|nr:hypothetical protein [Burkholderiales bacterium]